MPHFVELARQRFGEAETAGHIAERLHREITLMLRDSACAPRVTAMIIQFMQGNVDSILQLLLDLPDLKKLVEQAEVFLGGRGQQDPMEVDQPVLRMGESTLIVPANDNPVLPDNVQSNFADPVTFDALREIAGFLRTNTGVGNGGGEAGLRARRAGERVRRGTRTSRWELRVLYVSPAGDRVIHSLPPIYLVVFFATLVLLLK
ncbi:hypothetical protein BD410DRAFT_807219 [Rickenella mellea]|uniref:Uncharacterized protein n=1 Tax=Rickenella mellea TaxID=50990 RepID=A0A4Y7PSW4_9AGAM|nr:hypothetical protein BD410DRAFT_807219 [Rickenella mellea]